MVMFRAHLKARHKTPTNQPLEPYDYQEVIARIIFSALIENYQLTSNSTIEDIRKLKTLEQAIEISRQAGKTSIIVQIIEFVMIYFPKIFNKSVRIGIFAPQREQAKTDFDRLKLSLSRTDDLVVGDDEERAKEESNANTIVLRNGSSCYIFPVTPTSKPESKTLDLIVFEESQDLPDRIVKEQILPMGATTNAPRIFIGTAGTKICAFYRLGQEANAIKLYADGIVADRRQMYERTNDPSHLVYEQTLKNDIVKYGKDSDEIQRPYFGKWLIGTGQFVTQEALDALVTDRKRTNHEKKNECFAGIDTAKHPDSTVVTIIRDNKDLKKRELINWLELRGENYKDQFDIIIDFLNRYNVLSVAIDSTGQGDFMPDMFERESRWMDDRSGLYRVKFSIQSKDIIYKNLKVVIRELLTTLPDLSTKEGVKFRQQMLDLQQEWKGAFLSAHHPDDDNAHDDYCDSWALAEHAFATWAEANFADVHIIETETNVRQNKESDFFGDHWGDD